MIIEGFARAKPVLSRQAVSGLGDISDALKERLEKMFGTPDAEQVVAQIIRSVRERGDAALRDYTLRIDGVELGSLAVSRGQIDTATREVAPDFLTALKLAAERIAVFHITEKEALLSGVSRMGGKMLVRPLERVGIYIPGGTASYPSTVLMTVIPARAAGVGEIILMTPPQKNGRVSPFTLAAAQIAGVSRIFSVGGAQAIAALAYGTESVPKVDKICGPGNIFVMLAKKQVFGAVDIDGLQGPSEVLIIADAKADPSYCAADLLAQAEHDPLASAILITTSRVLADEVNRELAVQLTDLPRRDIAGESLGSRGKIAVVSSVDEAIALANLYAPEHLCLMVENAESYIDKITNAGCIFVGDNTAEVLGDYVAGPSHALPTGGTARFSSPLNVMDFIKLINVVALNEENPARLWRAAATIARAEGLEAHARAADKRLKS
ncbi:MAG: histidinol dehydrogenase [Chloroflexota bacterium]